MISRCFKISALLVKFLKSESKNRNFLSEFGVKSFCAPNFFFPKENRQIWHDHRTQLEKLAHFHKAKAYFLPYFGVLSILGRSRMVPGRLGVSPTSFQGILTRNLILQNFFGKFKKKRYISKKKIYNISFFLKQSSHKNTFIFFYLQ